MIVVAVFCVSLIAFVAFKVGEVWGKQQTRERDFERGFRAGLDEPYNPNRCGGDCENCSCK